ncbi:arsenate reductase (glutaredoxin) [Marivirga lumbricoides]|uniref:Arsenate reductase (Glutaredoxin) n=1 Tax=Marivirga lumbricoides TaxID=1046115 RepID=A0A2T4DLZ4_9BACT|nr:arsenate reductase (glutaredoxin) [Marivirga lumbricoides]GGC31102.1 arsenate reductase (glutaredoxin) [Marivirga lumbricoides]
MKILHNPRCAKSREALKILVDKEVNVDIVEYLKNVPTKAEMKEIIAKLGIKAEDLIRKNEAVYKENYKGKELSESEWVDAMISEPKLIERPIVIEGDKAIIGRPPEKVLSLL